MILTRADVAPGSFGEITTSSAPGRSRPSRRHERDAAGSLVREQAAVNPNDEIVDRIADHVADVRHRGCPHAEPVSVGHIVTKPKAQGSARIAPPAAERSSIASAAHARAAPAAGDAAKVAHVAEGRSRRSPQCRRHVAHACETVEVFSLGESMR